MHGEELGYIIKTSEKEIREDRGVGRIYGTKVNHMTNPVGFYLNRTVFSWKVDGCLVDKQKYARILVA